MAQTLVVIGLSTDDDSMSPQEVENSACNITVGQATSHIDFNGVLFWWLPTVPSEAKIYSKWVTSYPFVFCHIRYWMSVMYFSANIQS